jgi:hypothetical protein
MSWQPVVLWTDALLFMMVGAIILIVGRRHPQGQLHEAWQRLWQMPMAMATGLVLLVFVVIALLDSLHYRPLLPAEPGQPAQYGVEVVSVLDTLLQPLREHKEKTYSAPLATRLYVKETVTLDNGTVLRDYPRLQFGGVQLLHPQQDRRGDIVRRVMRGSVIGLFGSVLLAILAAC